jgi:hypothetical protein
LFNNCKTKKSTNKKTESKENTTNNTNNSKNVTKYTTIKTSGSYNLSGNYECLKIDTTGNVTLNLNGYKLYVNGVEYTL